MSTQFKETWVLMGSVVILFALYHQFTNNNYSAIIPLSLMYWFLYLAKQKEKGKMALVQVVGAVLVWSLTLLNWSEFIRGPILIILLTVIYLFNRRILKTNEHAA